ncbi:MAG: hypothetical protein V4578_24760, partial [Pseudomonadota bacterium]
MTYAQAGRQHWNPIATDLPAAHDSDEGRDIAGKQVRPNVLLPLLQAWHAAPRFQGWPDRFDGGNAGNLLSSSHNNLQDWKMRFLIIERLGAGDLRPEVRFVRADYSAM